MNDAKRHAPATLRNREAIAEVLAKELPASGTVLEVASGSGEHAVYFAQLFPGLDWQPSDPDPSALASIDAWRAEATSRNLRAAMELNAAAKDWPVAQADAVFCANMVHIAPWEAAEGLVAGAGELLQARAPLILYGPFFENEVDPAPSNLAFDESLRSRDARWGIRSREDFDRLAAEQGFSLSARHAMPANNLTLVYRKN